ncbi:MAG: CDP-glucose 4,6-dehydratase [Sterolibacterium sp.]|nr:CDP-glucose 4,6-dehydratase [Sterolibacterium sp.]
MDLNLDFWRGKRVFLTGHTGFKGSWLALWLNRLGAEVTGYALPPPTSPSLFETAGVGSILARSHVADVRNLDALGAAVRAAQPEIVFHLAAQPIVRASYQEPVATYATNVMGTVHLLEALRGVGSLRAALIITSDKCYENREWAWGYRENEAMGGHDPYASSKGCAELVTAAYRRSFFAAGLAGIASARAGNVIGGGDWAVDRLLPDLVRAFSAGRPVTLRSPGAIRPWQHVLEPLAGYLLLAEHLCGDNQAFVGGWNFGSRDEDTLSVGEVVAKVATLWGECARWNIDTSPQPHEANYLKLDCSLARDRLGWKPRLNLDLALSWTLDWYLAQRSGADMREFSNAQLESYMALPA